MLSGSVTPEAQTRWCKTLTTPRRSAANRNGWASGVVAGLSQPVGRLLGLCVVLGNDPEAGFGGFRRSPSTPEGGLFPPAPVCRFLHPCGQSDQRSLETNGHSSCPLGRLRQARDVCNRIRPSVAAVGGSLCRGPAAEAR